MDDVLNAFFALIAPILGLALVLLSFIIEDMICFASLTKATGRHLTLKHLNSQADWVAANPHGARFLQSVMLTGAVLLPIIGMTAGTWTVSAASILWLPACGVMELSLFYAIWIVYKAATKRPPMPDVAAGLTSENVSES